MNFTTQVPGLVRERGIRHKKVFTRLRFYNTHLRMMSLPSKGAGFSARLRRTYKAITVEIDAVKALGQIDLRTLNAVRGSGGFFVYR